MISNAILPIATATIAGKAKIARMMNGLTVWVGFWHVHATPGRLTEVSLSKADCNRRGAPWLSFPP